MSKNNPRQSDFSAGRDLDARRTRAAPKKRAPKATPRVLGTKDQRFSKKLLEQMYGTAEHLGKIDKGACDLIFAAVKDSAPKDAIEAMLITQIAALHNRIMMLFRLLNYARTAKEEKDAEVALNKLLRAYSQLVDTLRKYRNGGEQRVIVQHVSVADGGQAIVGNVKGGGS